jgi:hypothetical protein
MSCTYLVVDIWYKLLVCRFSDITQLWCIFRWEKTVIPNKGHALVGHAIPFHVNLITDITCKNS